MKVLDRHFIRLPLKKKSFVIIIGTGYFLVGLSAYIYKLTNVVESLLVIVVGVLFAEIIKMSYRIETLEGKKGNK